MPHAFFYHRIGGVEDGEDGHFAQIISPEREAQFLLGFAEKQGGVVVKSARCPLVELEQIGAIFNKGAKSDTGCLLLCFAPEDRHFYAARGWGLGVEHGLA
jgi:hypothetical protein